MALFDMGSRSERDTDEGDQHGAGRTLAGIGKPWKALHLKTVMQP